MFSNVVYKMTSLETLIARKVDDIHWFKLAILITSRAGMRQNHIFPYSKNSFNYYIT